MMNTPQNTSLAARTHKRANGRPAKWTTRQLWALVANPLRTLHAQLMRTLPNGNIPSPLKADGTHIACASTTMLQPLALHSHPV